MLLDDRKLDAVGRVLLKAADYMQKHGWCQGTMMNMSGNVCLVGALEVAEPSNLSFIAETRLAAYTRHAYGRGVVSTNDTVLKSKDEAVAVLRNAATFKP